MVERRGEDPESLADRLNGDVRVLNQVPGEFEVSFLEGGRAPVCADL